MPWSMACRSRLKAARLSGPLKDSFMPKQTMIILACCWRRCSSSVPKFSGLGRRFTSSALHPRFRTRRLRSGKLACSKASKKLLRCSPSAKELPMMTMLLWGAGSNVQDLRSPVQENKIKISANNDTAQRLRLVMKAMFVCMLRLDIRINIRVKEIRIAQISHIGEVHAIDGRFAIHADHTQCRHQMKILLAARHQRVEHAIHCVIFLLDVLFYALIKLRMRINGVFDKQYGCFGMFLPDYSVKVLGTFFDEVDADVRHEVENNQGGLLRCDQLGKLVIQPGIATEAQINELPIKAPCQDIGMCHAGPCGTSALQDARAVTYYGLPGCWKAYLGLANECQGINPYLYI